MGRCINKEGKEMKCKCGHDKKDHIYEEGSCRPGFICEHCCNVFTPEILIKSETTQLEEEILVLKLQNAKLQSRIDFLEDLMYNETIEGDSHYDSEYYLGDGYDPRFD